MKKLDDYQKYLPILSKAKLFEGIPLEHYPQIFNFLQASILSFEKDELIQRLGEPLLYSGIVLDGTVEGSFINENYSKINMNHFERGRSFAEALACVQTPYSPIQLKALTNCTIMLINLKGIISPMRKLQEQIYKDYQISAASACEAEEIEVILNMIEHGFGISVLPYLDIFKNRNVDVLPLSETKWESTFYAIRRRDGVRSHGEKTIWSQIIHNSKRDRLEF